MFINGMGIVFAGGSGIEKFEGALAEPWVAPNSHNEAGLPSYQADLAGAGRQDLLKKIRRADKMSKMAVVAAADAAEDAGLENLAAHRVGVILSTAHGPHVTTFKFLDGIYDYGEEEVSPITFSNSVHNSTCSYIAQTMDIQGPTLTVTQFFHSFYNALSLASLWLADDRVDYALVGGVEQYGDVLSWIVDQKLTTAKDGMIKPFNLTPTPQVPGEGAAFFLVSKTAMGKAYCQVDDIFLGWDADRAIKADIRVIDSDGMAPDESAYLACGSSGVPMAAYSPLFGSMMSGSAFNMAAAALTLKHQRVYPNPVADNPHNLPLLPKDFGVDINRMSCLRFDCRGEAMGAHLSRA